MYVELRTWLIDEKGLCKLYANEIIVLYSYFSMVPRHHLVRLIRVSEAGSLMIRNMLIFSD